MITALALASTLQFPSLESATLEINGEKREFMYFLPKTRDARPRPLVFVFHGHGGNMRNAARTFKTHEIWPQAASVYMQGLPTPSKLVDPDGKKNGWQGKQGEMNDRDLKFFDKVYEYLQGKAMIDSKNVFSTGHSNGGQFTYLLWKTHQGFFRAIAPSAAGGGAPRVGDQGVPLLHLTGTNDPLVNPKGQMIQVAQMRRVNGITSPKTTWEGCDYWASEKGTPVAHYVFDGGHEFAPGGAELIVKFFKSQLSSR